MLALLAGAVSIGFAPILAKLAVNYDAELLGAELSPIAVGFWRMFFATPVFAAATLRAWARQTISVKDLKRAKQDLWILALPGIFFALDIGPWHWSFQLTSVANATLLANLAVVFVAITSWLFLGERFSAMFIIGAVSALLGMFGLLGVSFQTNPSGLIGDLMGVFVALMYTGYILASKKALARHSLLLMMTISTAVCGGLLLLFALLLPGQLLPQSHEAWLSVIGLALVSQVLGQGLIAYGIKFLPASLAAVTLIVQPMCAALFGWIILGQVLSNAQLASSIFIILGIYIAKRASLPEPNRAS